MESNKNASYSEESICINKDLMKVIFDLSVKIRDSIASVLPEAMAVNGEGNCSQDVMLVFLSTSAVESAILLASIASDNDATEEEYKRIHNAAVAAVNSIVGDSIERQSEDS